MTTQHRKGSSPRKHYPHSKKKPTPSVKKRNKPSSRFSILRNGLELAGVLVSLAVITIVILGLLAQQYSGTDILSHLIPFTAGIIGLVLFAGLIMVSWLKLRCRLLKFWKWLPPLLAISLGVGITTIANTQQLFSLFSHFKTLVGGKSLVQTENIAHQVYAAYRRMDPKLTEQLISRAEQYQSVIEETARMFALDPFLLLGLAATESSFLPRDSQDGGHGLFQITDVPGSRIKEAQQKLGNPKINLNDPKHNAFIAASTLKFYLQEMGNDPYLGLLAYNIGPKNGGLRFIMNQYGATDFVSMQPYLQILPRDYPIRVLSNALAFKLWKTQGQLLAYQDGKNALTIQSIGIPGLN